MKLILFCILNIELVMKLINGIEWWVMIIFVIINMWLKEYICIIIKNVFVCFCFYRIEVWIKKIVLLEVCNNFDVIY